MFFMVCEFTVLHLAISCYIAVTESGALPSKVQNLSAHTMCTRLTQLSLLLFFLFSWFESFQLELLCNKSCI